MWGWVYLVQHLALLPMINRGGGGVLTGNMAKLDYTNTVGLYLAILLYNVLVLFPCWTCCVCRNPVHVWDSHHA